MFVEQQGLQLQGVVAREAAKQARSVAAREAWLARCAVPSPSNDVDVQGVTLHFPVSVRVLVERVSGVYFASEAECFADEEQRLAVTDDEDDDDDVVVMAARPAAALAVETPRDYDVGARAASTQAVLLDGDVVVGDIKISHNHGVHEVYLHYIRVAPTHRGMGGARAMLCGALGEALQPRDGVQPTTFGLYMLSQQAGAATHLYIDCAALFGFKLACVLVHGWSVTGYGRAYTGGRVARAITFFFERDLSRNVDLPAIMPNRTRAKKARK